MKFLTIIKAAPIAVIMAGAAQADVKTYEVTYVVSEHVTQLADLKCATFHNDVFVIDMAVDETPFDWTNEYADYMCRIKRYEEVNIK